MDNITLVVLTPTGEVFSGNANYVSLPEQGGRIGILQGHAPLLAALEEGEILCRQESGTIRIWVRSGVAEVSDNHIAVLSASAKLVE